MENLKDAWRPRYLRAEEQHRRFALRIEHTNRAARRYFDTQEELNRRIGNLETGSGRRTGPRGLMAYAFHGNDRLVMWQISPLASPFAITTSACLTTASDAARSPVVRM